jgi:hypothetical protein
MQVQLQYLSWNSHDYSIYIYPTYTCDKIQYVFSKLILTWKFPAYSQMIWKVTYTNKQMWKNEANSSIHVLYCTVFRLCPYIQSVTNSSPLGCAAVSFGGQFAAFWSIMMLSEHQELLALWHSGTSHRTWILHTQHCLKWRPVFPPSMVTEDETWFC